MSHVQAVSVSHRRRILNFRLISYGDSHLMILHVYGRRLQTQRDDLISHHLLDVGKVKVST